MNFIDSYRFAVLNSKVGGSLLIKLWAGNGVFDYENNMKRFYKTVKLVKPDASRKDSAEIYLLARHFKGAKPIEKTDEDDEIDV